MNIAAPIRILILTVFLALTGCSTGIVRTENDIFVCYNAGKTSCVYEVVYYGFDGKPTKKVDIEVKGGSFSGNFVDVIVGLGAYLGGLF